MKTKKAKLYNTNKLLNFINENIYEIDIENSTESIRNITKHHIRNDWKEKYYFNKKNSFETKVSIDKNTTLEYLQHNNCVTSAKFLIELTEGDFKEKLNQLKIDNELKKLINNIEIMQKMNKKIGTHTYDFLFDIKLHEKTIEIKSVNVKEHFIRDPEDLKKEREEELQLPMIWYNIVGYKLTSLQNSNNYFIFDEFFKNDLKFKNLNPKTYDYNINIGDFGVHLDSKKLDQLQEKYPDLPDLKESFMNGYFEESISMIEMIEA